MNKIVREYYPVSRLPEDLRVGLDAAEAARVTVEPEGRASPPRSLTELLDEARRMREDGTIRAISTDEAVARVRALRDEWD